MAELEIIIISIIYIIYFIIILKRPIIGLLVCVFLVAGVRCEALFFNDVVRLGKIPISIFDVAMFPFLLSGILMILRQPKILLINWKYTSSFFLLLISLTGTFWGLFQGYDIRITLREFRNLLYFVIVVISTAKLVYTNKKLLLIENLIIFSGITESIWTLFYFTKGISEYGFFVSSSALRAKALMQTVPAMASGLLVFRQINTQGLHALALMSLQLLFFISIVASMTRSAWLYYMLVIILIIYFSLRHTSSGLSKTFLILGSLATILLFIKIYSHGYYTETKTLVESRLQALFTKGHPENTWEIRVDEARAFIISLPYHRYILGMGLGAGLYGSGGGPEIVPVWYLWKLGIIGLLIWMITYTAGFFHPCFYLDKSSKIKTEASKWFVATVPFLFIGSITGTFMTTAGYILSGLYIGINWKYIEINSKLENK